MCEPDVLSRKERVKPRRVRAMAMTIDCRKSQQEVVNFLAGGLISWQWQEADNCSLLLLRRQKPVFHSKTKHIEIRHHFIRDAYEKKLIQVLKIHTDDNVGDLLTKAFDVSRLRATYGAELVSAASLVNTARPTLSTARLVNDEKQIHATVDSKAVVVTEASIRSFYSHNVAVVFSNMSRKGVKFLGKVTPLFDSMLVPHQAPEGEGSEQPTEPQPTPVPTQPSIGDQPLFKPSHDSPSFRVLALETSKDAQAAKILKLNDQIKKLKRKCKPSISHHKAWLKSVKTLSMKKRLGRKEFDVVNEGGKVMKTDLGLTKACVDCVGKEDSVVEPRTPPTTTSILDDEDITMAQTLIKMKEEKTKEKGVSIKDIKDSSRPARSILTLKPLPTIDPKDKGKSVLEEPKPAKKMTRSDFDAAQIARDTEIARQLQVDLQAEVERERQREEEASKAAIAETYDKVQAGIDVDSLKFKATQRSAKIRGLYERQKRVIDDFKPIDSDDAVKDSKEAAGVHTQKVLEEPDSTKVEVKKEGHEESVRKRPGKRLKIKA
ncbi:hypothetical protein Tco_0738325, partial [Tanacetum coccineum]